MRLAASLAVLSDEGINFPLQGIPGDSLVVKDVVLNGVYVGIHGARVAAIGLLLVPRLDEILLVAVLNGARRYSLDGLLRAGVVGLHHGLRLGLLATSEECRSLLGGSSLLLGDSLLDLSLERALNLEDSALKRLGDHQIRHLAARISDGKSRPAGLINSVNNLTDTVLIVLYEFHHYISYSL